MTLLLATEAAAEAIGYLMGQAFVVVLVLWGLKRLLFGGGDEE